MKWHAATETSKEMMSAEERSWRPCVCWICVELQSVLSSNSKLDTSHCLCVLLPSDSFLSFSFFFLCLMGCKALGECLACSTALSGWDTQKFETMTTEQPLWVAYLHGKSSRACWKPRFSDFTQTESTPIRDTQKKGNGVLLQTCKHLPWV